MGFLPYCNSVSTIVLVYHVDSNEMPGVKAGLELYTCVVFYFEQIMESTAIRPLASHLINHPSKTNEVCRALLEK